MVANNYYVRRWGLEKLVMYSSKDRATLRFHKATYRDYYVKALKEFELGQHTHDRAYALYDLAAKLALTFNFRKAAPYLKKAKQIAELHDDIALLKKIADVETSMKDKNRHPRDYVTEFGLDLP